MGKFGSYNELSTGADDDLLLVLDDSASETKYITLANILAYILNKTLTSPHLNEAVALTATSTELSELHSQGAVAADFAKLAAITASAAEINQNNDGVPARSSNNAGPITVSSFAEVVTLDLGTLSTGDFFVIFGYLSGNKGGIAGNIQFGAYKSSGTATVLFQDGVINPDNILYATASTFHAQNVTQLGYVSSGGTFVANLRAGSSGSDLTGANARIQAVIWKKQ